MSALTLYDGAPQQPTKQRVPFASGDGSCRAWPGLNAVFRGTVLKGIVSYGRQFIGFKDGWGGVLERQTVALPDTVCAASPSRAEQFWARPGPTHCEMEPRTLSRMLFEVWRLTGSSLLAAREHWLRQALTAPLGDLKTVPKHRYDEAAVLFG